MSKFFNKETLEIIKKNESNPQKITNFIKIIEHVL